MNNKFTVIKKIVEFLSSKYAFEKKILSIKLQIVKKETTIIPVFKWIKS